MLLFGAGFGRFEIHTSFEKSETDIGDVHVALNTEAIVRSSVLLILMEWQNDTLGGAPQEITRRIRVA